MTFSVGDQELANFRSKYAAVHPLAFQRSLERASSALELFEMLEGVPSGCPFSWDEKSRSWTKDEDVMAVESLKSMKKGNR